MKLNNIRIAIKLPVFVLIAASIVALGLGYSSYQSAAKNSKALIHEALHGSIIERKTALLNYLGSIEEDWRAVASNPYTNEARGAFSAAWKELGNNPT